VLETERGKEKAEVVSRGKLKKKEKRRSKEKGRKEKQPVALWRAARTFRRTVGGRGPLASSPNSY